jgi:hypothetical protein
MHRRKYEEEEQLLRDFVATAPACGVPVESKIVDATTSFGACDFTQSIGAELLIVPARARRRRHAIGDGLGAARYPVQSLNRAGKLEPVRTCCKGCHFPNAVCRTDRR